MNDALNVCLSGINAVFSWMEKVYTAIPGSFIFILAMIGVFTVFRLLLVPVMGVHIGGAGSDFVRFMGKAQSSNEVVTTKQHRMTKHERVVVAKQHASRIFGGE